MSTVLLPSVFKEVILNISFESLHCSVQVTAVFYIDQNVPLKAEIKCSLKFFHKILD